MLHQEKQKRPEISVFEPTDAVIFPQKRTCILKRHAGKSVESLFFEAGDTAI